LRVIGFEPISDKYIVAIGERRMDFTFEIESTDADGIDAIRRLAEEKTTILQGPNVIYPVTWSGHYEERGMLDSFATILGQIHIDPGLLEHARTFAAEVAAAIPAELLVKLLVETFSRPKAPKPAPASPTESATTVLKLQTDPGKDVTVTVSCRDPVELQVTLSEALTVHVKRS
jgi:hypothetical protein